MHMVIRAIVYAKTKEEAMKKAHEVFSTLAGEDGQPFDYYTTFDDTEAKVSGRARWGAIPYCVQASSKTGKELIKQGMQATYREFIKNMKIIRKVLAKQSNRQIFESQQWDRYMIKYRLRAAGECRGCHTWLYDNEGEGIRSSEHLRNVLSKWRCLYEEQGKTNPYKDDKVWVVPCDVHF